MSRCLRPGIPAIHRASPNSKRCNNLRLFAEFCAKLARARIKPVFLTVQQTVKKLNRCQGHQYGDFKNAVYEHFAPVKRSGSVGQGLDAQNRRNPIKSIANCKNPVSRRSTSSNFPGKRSGPRDGVPFSCRANVPYWANTLVVAGHSAGHRGTGWA